jgi:tetratricopeptide (TPR) repeat protein
MRGGVLRLTMLVTALSGVIAAPRAQAPMSATEALNRYAAGDWDAASRYAATARFDAVLFVREVQAWAGEGLLGNAVRQRRAAAFGLEVAWAFGREAPITARPRPGPTTALIPILAWACEAMPGTSAGHAADRPWWRLSVALLQHARQWPVLLGNPTAPPAAGPLQRLIGRENKEGHLSHARRRLPREPRLRLAEAISREGAMLTQLIGSGESRRPALLRFDDLPEAKVAEIRANASRNPAGVRRAAALAAWPEVDAQLKALAREPDIGAEATLHRGYLRLVLRDYEGAVTELERAAAGTTDAFLQFLSRYFLGWTHHRLGNPDAAIAAYRDALRSMPGARVVATLLAEQLFLTDRRDDAFELLDRTFTPATPDYEPLVWFKRGDARFIETLIAELRQALLPDLKVRPPRR